MVMLAFLLLELHVPVYAYTVFCAIPACVASISICGGSVSDRAPCRWIMIHIFVPDDTETHGLNGQVVVSGPDMFSIFFESVLSGKASVGVVPPV